MPRAAKAGAVGEVNKLGLAPNQKSTGKYSDHFDKWALDDADVVDTYDIDIGRRLKTEAARVFGSVPMCIPHELGSLETLRTPCVFTLRFSRAEIHHDTELIN